MRPQLLHGKIRPKIKSMPRQKSEAAVYLDVYKLAVERERLERELSTLQHRSVQIQERVAEINKQVNGLEKGAQESREPLAAPVKPVSAASTGDYKTLFFEY